MTGADWIAVAVAAGCGAGIMAVFVSALRPARTVEPVPRRAVERIIEASRPTDPDGSAP